MTIEFTQSGLDLLLGTDGPVQFSRGTPVQVTLTDDTFTSADDLSLNFIPEDGRKHAPARVPLTKSDADGVYTGVIGKAATLKASPAAVSLGGIVTSTGQVITSRAERVMIDRSVDPEAVPMPDSESLAGFIRTAIDGYAGEHGITTGATAAEAAQIKQNTGDVTGLKSDLSDITTFGKNILQPIASAVSSGVTSVYDKSTDCFRITGTKDSGDYTRIIIGTLIPKQDGGYTCSIIDNSGNGKSAIYIYNGDTKIVTIGATSFKNYFELEKGVTYTFEVYVAPKTVVDYNISIMIAYGTDTDFEPYALYVPVEKIANIDLSDKNIDLSDKYLSILGVSIDTYSGWIPDGNVAYYSDNNLESVNNTWWKKLIDATGINLVLNNSYTGACATTNGKDYASSGVARCTNLTDGLHTPNVIFIGSFAANDWMYSECGSWDMSMSDLLAGVNVDLSVSENYEQYKSVTETYAGAMATIFYRIQEQFPDARIFALDMYNYTRSNGKNPPRRSLTNKTYTIAQYNKALYDVADYFGVRVVPVSKCGINAKNSVSYTVEGEEAVSNLHPNIDGQDMIYHSVYETMKNAFD